MSDPTPDDWTALGRTWRGMPTPPPARRAGWAAIGRRLRLAMGLELVVAALLVGLGWKAIQEHPGTAGWLAGLALALHAGLIVAVAVLGQRTVRGLMTESTREFLAGWRRACRRQLLLIRGFAVLVLVEVAALVAWFAAGTQGGSPRIVAAEWWWYGSLVGLLAVAGWFAASRSRALAALARIAEAEDYLTGHEEIGSPSGS